MINSIKLLIGLYFLVLFSCSNTERLQLSPNETINTSQQEILKFSKFDGLSPLFTHNDDTLRVINFWATWCKPCVKELPYFEQLNREFEKQGAKAKVQLISLDMTEKNLTTFVEKKKLKTSTYWLDDPDANAWVGKVNQDWDGAIPVTLILKNGKIRFHNTDFESYDELKEFVFKK